MSERRNYCTADWFTTKSRMAHGSDVNPTLPAKESTSLFEEAADAKYNDQENLYSNNCSLTGLTSEQIRLRIETLGVGKSSAEDELLEDDLPVTSSFSSSVANSEEPRNDSSNGTTREFNELLSSENPPLDIALPRDDNEEMNVVNDVLPTTTPKSPKVHLDSAQNVTRDLEQSAAIKTHSRVPEKNASSPQKSDTCSEEMSVVPEEIIDIKKEEVMITEEPCYQLTETEISYSKEDTTEVCTEIREACEEVGVKDVEHHVMEVNGPKASQSKENTSDVGKEIKTPLPEDNMSRDVPVDTEIMDFEDISTKQNLIELNNNASPVDHCGAELENLDVVELFEGPIGYGTDLDDSPSMETMAYGCGICYCIVGYTRESFTRHQKKFHWISLQCKVCKKCFVTTKAYENHMTTHIRYPCLHCPKEFKHPLEVEDHQGQHFSNKLIRCERCGEEFYLLATLKQHHSFMGTKCVEIQKNVRRIQQQLASPLANEELGKCSKGSTSRVPKSELVENTKSNSNRNDIPKPTVETRRSKRMKYEVKYEF